MGIAGPLIRVELSLGPDYVPEELELFDELLVVLDTEQDRGAPPVLGQYQKAVGLTDLVHERSDGSSKIGKAGPGDDDSED